MKIAIVQIRGPLKVKPKMRVTFRMLNLPKKHSCVIVDGSNEVKGMILRLKDYVTWGEIDADTFKLLVEKRGKLAGSHKVTNEYLKEKVKMDISAFVKSFIEGKIKIKDVPGMKPFFRLNPPRGGFERKGVKQPFSLGGVLGYRGAKINDLIKRML